METNLFKTLIISLLALYFCVNRTITPQSDNSDNSPDPFLKFSHENLLLSSGLTVKSKNNIFGLKFPPKSPSAFGYLNILLILSGNIELNPGPVSKQKQTRFPCGICTKPCTSKQPSVACDSCDVWFHQRCLKMNTAIFNNLQNVSWLCCKCGLPNFSSSLFSQSLSSLNCSNSFESLHSSFVSEPIPISTSTPNSKFKVTKFNGLNTIVINFRSLFKKRAEVSNLLHETKCDVVIGTETWLTSDHKTSELLLNDYDVFRNDRPSRAGGVLIAVKRNLNAVQIPSPSYDNESVFCKVNIKGKKPIIFGSVYRPTNNDFDYSAEVISEIYSIYNKFKNATFWLGGDFNLPDIDWKKHEIIGNQYPERLNTLYLEMSQDLCLDQIQEFPTCRDQMFDLIFTNRPDIAKTPKLRPAFVTMT